MRIGFHLPISQGFVGTLREAKRLRCEAVQIFLKNPRSWAPKELGDKEKNEFMQLKEFCTVVGHLSYLPNLAKIDIDMRNMTGFLHEAELCSELGIKQLVVHCGSRKDRRKGVEMAAKAIDSVLNRFNIDILLENSAGQGDSIGSSIGDIGEIYLAVQKRERLFLCIDTAHLFQYGYDIRSRNVFDSCLTGIENAIGIDRIACFHLNDSRTSCGSRADRHWHIGKGCIGLDAFSTILSDHRFAHLPGVMETPREGDMDKKNMEIVRSLSPSLMSRPSS